MAWPHPARKGTSWWTAASRLSPLHFQQLVPPPWPTWELQQWGTGTLSRQLSISHMPNPLQETPTGTTETSHSRGWQSCTSSPAREGRQPHGSAEGKRCLATAHFPKPDSSLLMPGQSHLLSSPRRGSSPCFEVALNHLSAVCGEWVTLSNCQLISIITDWHTLYAGLISLQMSWNAPA